MLIEEGVARIMRSSGFDRLDGAPSREWLAPLRFEVDQVANLRWMMETGQPLVIPNVRDYPGWVDVPEARRLLAYVGAPIRWQGQTVGFLNLDSTVSRFYTTAHAERLKAFADQAAIAIENARLYDAMRQHDEEIAALYRASAQLLNPGGSLASLAEQIVLAVTREFALANCGLLLMDDRGTALVRVVQAGSLEVYGHQNLPLDGPGLTVAAARTGEMVYAPNVGRDPRYLSSDERTHSELVVPLYAGGLVIGVIDLQSPDEDAFDERARRIASAFAERAGLALENVRLFEAAYRQARQIGILNSMTRAALEVGDFDELVRTLVNRLIELFVADNCFLTLWDEALQLTIPTAASGALHVDYAAVQLDPGEDTLTARVLRDRRALVVEDVYHSPLVSEILKVRIPSDKFPTHSLLILPLIAADQKLGAVLIGFNQPRQVSQDEIALGEQAAGQIALAVAQAQLLERLQLARQAAEGANQLKSEFLANTSHELRTPLTGILGSLSLVIDGLCESPEEEREFLQIAYSSSQNLLTILNDVLNFAKIEAGKIEVERQVLDVTGLMEEVVALTRVQAEEKQLRLELQLPDPSLPVLADPDKVRQILLNLVGNALKFTERGRVWVEAQADVAAGQMRIAVHDTGIGIPPDKQSRLFQPFVQADGSMTRKYGGTGLGLSISRQFAERMGGTLMLHSAGAGLGSTFTLRLLLADETLL
jgi:signal transduction histidine kinase